MSNLNGRRAAGGGMTSMPRPGAMARNTANPKTPARAAAASRPFAWIPAPVRPLDAGGPSGRPYEPLGEDFASIPACDHLRRIAAEFPDKLAVADDTIKLSYRQLVRAVDWLARRIAAAVPEGQAVGLLLGNSAWYPVGLFAGLSCGRLTVPLNPRDPPQRILDIARDAQLPAVIGIGADRPPGWPDRHDLQWIDTTEALREFVPKAVDVFGMRNPVDMPAVVLYTSGSTGRPKGIVNSERSLLQRVQQYADAGHIGADDVLMPLSGPATIAGCREVLTALTVGATLQLVDVEAVGLRAVRRRFRSSGVTIVYIVPTLVRALMTPGDDDFATLRIVRIAGERILWADIAAVRAVVSPECLVQISYSSTETTGSQWFPPKDHPQDGVCVPGGYLLAGISYAVLGDDGAPVGPGEIGELVIRSQFVALGHWANGRIVPTKVDPGDPSLRIMATGDLVSLAPDGLLRIVGRKGRQLKINGRRVEPAELEAVLRKAPRVQDAVALPTEAGELIAFVVTRDGGGKDLPTALRHTVRAALPPPLHPARLHLVAEIPRLAGGKADAVALRRMDEEKRETPPIVSRSHSGAAEDSSIEAVVARVWMATLRIGEAKGRWDEAGGDSLKLLQCVLDIENELGRELSMDAFRVDMSLAEMIEAAKAVTDPQHKGAAEGDNARPILFVFPGSVGYGPSMAAFGSGLSHVSRVVPIRYPNLEAILDGQGTLAAMTESALGQIAEVQPEGEIRLLGYSLGGAVAFEVAARLLAAGRPIRFLGILDTNVGGGRGGRGEAASRTLQRIRTHRVTPYRMLCRSVAKMVARLGEEKRFARIIDGAWPQRLHGTQFMLRLELEEILRMRAMTHWLAKTKTPLPITGTLFRCNRLGLSADLGWQRMVGALAVVPIAGGHLDLVAVPHLSHNRALIEQALVASYQ
jgi:acyl-CoA synthetase (AMP-forming)/AMP-acid ligase II/thioesterase domain-containing protein